jgi:hypothetical protein
LQEERLVFGFQRRGGWRGVQILFETSLEKRVVGDIPTFPISGNNIAAGIEEGYVFSKKA